MDSSLILFIMAPIFIIFIIIEIILNWESNVYSLKDTITNISLSIMYQATDVLFTIFIVKSVYTFIYSHGLHIFSTTNCLNFILLFVFQDFLYYWFHRASHSIRWNWSAHVTHHSSIRFNFSTSFRQSLMYPISGMWLFWLPLAFIGFHPNAVLSIVAINLGFQFFVHTQLIDKFSGKLIFIEKIFNTPSHHRVHHASNLEYHDKNFGGLLIIWDRIFGTFETEIEKPNYGIYNKPDSYNPLKLVFNEWCLMIKDVWQYKDIRYLWIHHPMTQTNKNSNTVKT